MSLGRVSALALLMLSLGSAVALADTNLDFSQQIAQNQNGPRRGRGGGESRLMQELNLSQEQQQRLNTIRQQSQQQIQQRKQALRQAKQELANLMASNADDNTIRAKYNQVQQLQQQMADLRFQNMLAMRNVLTPEQRQRFAQLMQQRQQNVRNRTGNRTAPQQ